MSLLKKKKNYESEVTIVPSGIEASDEDFEEAEEATKHLKKVLDENHFTLIVVTSLKGKRR